MQQSLSLVIAESSQVGAARRHAIALAASQGFSETKQGEVALIITEVANNLLRHASHGEIFVRKIDAPSGAGLEITAVDRGAGMASVRQCLRDGFSTAGTPGNGLGAIARLSQVFEIFSVVDGGTVLLSQVWAQTAPSASTPVMNVGAISRPKPGQDVCGDSWGVEHLPSRSVYFLADGLGHGPDAALASQQAVRAFRKNRAQPPEIILERVHLALSGTRGVAAAVVEIHFEKQEAYFAGVGNIAGTLLGPDRSQSMVSHNGIVGHQVRKIHTFTYGWAPDALLVLHSDGLSTRWQVERYPGLIVRHPGLIAGVLYRDFQRGNDDATVVVASMSSTSGAE